MSGSSGDPPLLSGGTARSKPVGAKRSGSRLYWWRTRDPLPNLLFLLPLVLLYEATTRLGVSAGASPDQPLVAQQILDVLASWLGVVGSWVAPFALVGTLLFWHLYRRDPWRLSAATPLLMLLESVALTTPLLVLNGLLLQAGGSSWQSHGLAMTYGLGAGIYEELVFRLLLISGLVFVLRATHAPRRWAVASAVILAGLIFAAFHVSPLGDESFDSLRFAARTAAGCYLGVVFLSRGIGIAAGCHAAYNVLLIAIEGLVA